MDQKEIDKLLGGNTFDEYNQKQEELIKNINEKEKIHRSPTPSTPIKELEKIEAVAEKKEGKVMGQLTRVTEEAEHGTNMVMGFMEEVLNIVSKQQTFIKDIRQKYLEDPRAIQVDETLAFLYDEQSMIEDKMFQAMDAFQFQDIGRQKLMKVMYTLAKLNEYLNELLGADISGNKEFGKEIDKKSLEKDKDKTHVDDVVQQFKAQEPPPSGGEGAAPDVDSIIAEFQKKNKPG